MSELTGEQEVAAYLENVGLEEKWLLHAELLSTTLGRIIPNNAALRAAVLSICKLTYVKGASDICVSKL